MTTTDIRTRLHDEIDHSDERLLKMIYALVEKYQETETEELSDIRRKLITAEREKYLRGEGKSYSWEEVKNMAINRQRPS